jgi:hypothetical protein
MQEARRHPPLHLSTGEAVKPWPDRERYGIDEDQHVAEMERDAAMARLRAAVEALEQYYAHAVGERVPKP